MDWKGRLSSAKGLAAKGSHLLKGRASHLKELVGQAGLASGERTRAALEGFWPRVQATFQSHLKGPASAVLYNDKVMRRLLHLTYLKLPVVVAVTVEEEEFIRFCLDNRHRLLASAASVAPEAD